MGLRDTLNMSSGKVVLLGNEAIARGAIEAGVALATAYPGTPSTEIVEALAEVARDVGIYVEWSVNEKVAFEIAYSAATAGTRSLVAMKHVGLNVAADPLMSSAYTGVEEGFVIVSADDPSMWSSQNEQDNRIYGLHAYIPVFEPNHPKEAKSLVKEAFEFSARMKHPVIFRSTTRISHTRVVVELESIRSPIRRGTYVKNPKRYVLVPAHARELRVEMLKRWEMISREISKVPLNRIEGEGRVLIVAPGISYAYVKEALRILRLEDKIKLLKLATPVPIPRDMVLKAVEDVEKILVVEELEPVVEQQLKNLLFDEGIRVVVRGKDLVGYPYEMTVDRALKAIAKFLNMSFSMPEPAATQLPKYVFPRPPQLCPGCPYRPLFYVLRKQVDILASKKGREREPIFCGDIGCYTLGINPPFRVQDTCICMGASIGFANGFARVVHDRIPIAIIGDSTFYHAGIPPLINAVYNNNPLLVIILDNKTTAMTGHQPHPGVGITAMGEQTKAIDLEALVKALGIEWVKVIDPFRVKEAEKTIAEALEYVERERKPAVIISRRLCALVALRRALKAGYERVTYRVSEDKCRGCSVCYSLFACPAIRQKSLEDRRAYIDPELCTGCGVCADICPFNAIVLSKQIDRDEWLKFWS